MSDQQPNPMRLIYDESKGAHQTSKQLLPLLTLLEEPEGSGSLDEIKMLLATMVQILGQHSASLNEIKTSIGHGPGGASPTA
uniref:Uncharacterized protein n=1 Tax=Bosea sp. NBC_00436 TaxID=2969620 RepID=A0A9E8A1L2_9HYPH